MKQYSSFKKVDSFWFTEVPDHWKETKNRYIFKENNWVFEKGDFNMNESYDLRLSSAIEFYKLNLL